MYTYEVISSLKKRSRRGFIKVYNEQSNKTFLCMCHIFFSFDEVREYLEQHLTVILQSRILDGTDKTELYALYINCFEVKHWSIADMKFAYSSMTVLLNSRS